MNFACGIDFCIAITEDGGVYSWGQNSAGQLGLGHNHYQELPQKIEALDGENIIGICCGCMTSFAITQDGEVFVWGRIPDHFNVFHCPEIFSRNVECKETLSCIPQKMNISDGLPVVKIAADISDNLLVLTNDGYVFAWSYGKFYGNKFCFPSSVNIVDLNCFGWDLIAIDDKGGIFTFVYIGTGISTNSSYLHREQICEIEGEIIVKIIEHPSCIFYVTNLGNVYRGFNGYDGIFFKLEKKIVNDSHDIVDVMVCIHPDIILLTSSGHSYLYGGLHASCKKIQLPMFPKPIINCVGNDESYFYISHDGNVYMRSRTGELEIDVGYRDKKITEIQEMAFFIDNPLKINKTRQIKSANSIAKNIPFE